MPQEDLRIFSLDELNARLDDTHQEMMNLRFQVSTGELTDHTRIRKTRRQIARLLTIIHEFENEAKLESES